MSYDEWKLRSPDDDRELTEGRPYRETAYPAWVIEVESGVGWSFICCCFSKGEAEERARHFRPMACFSGRELRIRYTETV